MLLSSLLSTILLVTTARAKYIVPGARWLDTNGIIVNAHAGGITVDKDTGRFWWFGEYKIQGQPEGAGFRAYSSDDLATWTDEGMAFCMLAFLFVSSAKADVPSVNCEQLHYLAEEYSPATESGV